MPDIRQGAGDTTVNKLDNVLHLKEYSLVEESITLIGKASMPLTQQFRIPRRTLDAETCKDLNDKWEKIMIDL